MRNGKQSKCKILNSLPLYTAPREPGYQVTRLRLLRGLTQEQLATIVGTKQSSIARLESSSTVPSLSFLTKVAAALGARVEVRLTPIDAPVSKGA